MRQFYRLRRAKNKADAKRSFASVVWGAQATRAAKQFCHRTGVRKRANSVWIGVRKQTRWMGGQTIYHVMCYEQTAARKQIWQLRVFHSRRQKYKFCIRGAGFSAETVPIRKNTFVCYEQQCGSNLGSYEFSRTTSTL